MTAPMIVKLTGEDGCTCGGMQWGPGVTHRPRGVGRQLCGNGAVHFHVVPPGTPDEVAALVPILLNPIHARFAHPRAWEVRVESVDVADGLKAATYGECTTVRELPVAIISAEVATRWAILTTREWWRGPRVPVWESWADGWLSGADRSRTTAWAAVYATTSDAACVDASDAARAAYATTGAPDAPASNAPWAAYATSWAAWATRTATGATFDPQVFAFRLHELAVQAWRDEMALQEGTPHDSNDGTTAGDADGTADDATGQPADAPTDAD